MLPTIYTLNVFLRHEVQFSSVTQLCPTWRVFSNFPILIFLRLKYSWSTVMWVSGIQQSDSITHTHTHTHFQILFHHKLLQEIDYSSLCYTGDSCWLSILYYIVVCICLPYTPNLSLPPPPTLHHFRLWSPLPPLVTTSLLSMSVSLFGKEINLHYFLDYTYKWYHIKFVFVWLTSLGW